MDTADETMGEAKALDYVWNCAQRRKRIPYIVNRAIAQELEAIVRAYPRDWRTSYAEEVA